MLGEEPIPLGPRGLWAVREVECGDRVDALTAPVGRRIDRVGERRRPVGGIGVPVAVEGDDIDVQRHYAAIGPSMAEMIRATSRWRPAAIASSGVSSPSASSGLLSQTRT